MPFLSSAHTHGNWTHGRSSLEELLKQAHRLGFTSLGISEHAFQGYDSPCEMTPEGQLSYFRILHAARDAERQKGLRLWAGLELDMLACPEAVTAAKRDADYLVGSTHYLTTDYHGQCIAVDGDIVPLRDYIDAVFHGDSLAMIRFYYELETQKLLAIRPQIIGHFDLVRIQAPKGLFDETAPEYRRIALNALERAFPCGGILEVNTGAIARGYRKDPYPSLELLSAWREMGGQITITSDCHYAPDLNCAYDQAISLALEAGFTSAVQLGREDALFDTVPLE